MANEVLPAPRAQIRLGPISAVADRYTLRVDGREMWSLSWGADGAPELHGPIFDESGALLALVEGSTIVGPHTDRFVVQSSADADAYLWSVHDREHDKLVLVASLIAGEFKIVDADFHGVNGSRVMVSEGVAVYLHSTGVPSAFRTSVRTEIVLDAAEVTHADGLVFGPGGVEVA